MASSDYMITLNDGRKMPQIGFGTWNVSLILDIVEFLKKLVIKYGN